MNFTHQSWSQNSTNFYSHFRIANFDFEQKFVLFLAHSLSHCHILSKNDSLVLPDTHLDFNWIWNMFNQIWQIDGDTDTEGFRKEIASTNKTNKGSCDLHWRKRNFILVHYSYFLMCALRCSPPILFTSGLYTRPMRQIVHSGNGISWSVFHERSAFSFKQSGGLVCPSRIVF